MSTTTLDRPDTDIGHVHQHEHQTTDDPDDAAHIVMVPPGADDETPQAYVMRARVEGFPVTALCGHTWVPHKNPDGKAVCSRCLAIYQQPGDHRDERDDLPDA